MRERNGTISSLVIVQLAPGMTMMELSPLSSTHIHATPDEVSESLMTVSADIPSFTRFSAIILPYESVPIFVMNEMSPPRRDTATA